MPTSVHSPAMECRLAFSATCGSRLTNSIRAGRERSTRMKRFMSDVEVKSDTERCVPEKQDSELLAQ
jgi:hypothetical protein